MVISFIGLQAPAFAIFNIPRDLPKQPVLKQPAFPTEQKKADWAAAIPKQHYSVKSIIASSKPVAPIINEKSAWTEAPRAKVIIKNDYVKSDYEVKIMNRLYRNPGNPIPTSEVPEPGSIVGLSAGIVGLLFQVRRSRKLA